MGNVLSLMDQPEEETYTPRYQNPQQYPYPKYSSYGMLTSTEETTTRQSYEQSRYEKSKLGKIKRKELERLELEQGYSRKLSEQEVIERQRLQNEEEKRAASLNPYYQGNSYDGDGKW